MDKGFNRIFTGDNEDMFNFRSNDDRGVSLSRKRLKLLSQISSSVVWKNIDLVIIVTALNEETLKLIINIHARFKTGIY